jgi:hypothetical protein
MAVFEVTTNVFRGPRPKDLMELHNEGVTHVICLQSGVFERFHDDDYERAWQYEAIYSNMRRIDIDCGGILPPSKKEVADFIRVMRHLWDPNPGAPVIYIHCMAGKDRTGFMCAVFRMVLQRWSFDQAVTEMKAMGQHRRYRWWIPFLKAYAQYL